MPEVNFYILPTRTELERLQFACKLAEKVYRSGQFCYLLTENERQGKTLDDLLWTFRPGSFVPHRVYTGSATATADSVLIGTFTAPDQWRTVIINLSSGNVENVKDCERILEILDDNEAVKAEGRRRYKHYQKAGFTINTHKM